MALKYIIGTILLLVLLVATPSFAQNVDNAKSNKKKLRETRYKTRSKQGDKVQKIGLSGKKISKKDKKIKKSDPKPLHSSPNPYAGRKRKTEAERYKPSTGFFNQPSKLSENHKKGDISGNRLKYNANNARNRQPSHYAQPNPYANRRQRTESQRAKSNTPQLNSIRSISGVGGGGKKKKKRITPSSASRPYVARTKTSANIYYGRKNRGEKAHRKTIAGRKFTSPRSITKSGGVIKPSFNPYYAPKSKGDTPYTGKKSIRNQSATKRGERKYSGRTAIKTKSSSKKGENAWKNDITGRPFKSPKDPGLVRGKKGQPLFNSYDNKLKGNKNITGGRLSGGGYISATPKGERKNLSKNPNTSRTLSKSGKVQQGKGTPIAGKSIQNPSVSGFSGRTKSKGKISSGGGSISKSGWNNSGQALSRKPPGAGTQKGSQFKGRFDRFTISPGFDTRSAGFQGNTKGVRKPLKGGGSISKSGWNNKRQALPRNDSFRSGITLSQGNVKGVRKSSLKGGGSISKSGWNNRGNALDRKPPGDGTQKGSQFKGRFDRFTISPGFDTRSAGFQGNIKGARKPLKGGGSITKSGWNNKRSPLPRNDGFRSNMTLSQGNRKIDTRYLTSPYGNKKAIKVKAPTKMAFGINTQGNIKGARKPLKGGGSISKSGWNNEQTPLARNDNFRNGMTLSQGNIKGARKPLKGGGSISKSGWNNKGNALNRKPPGEGTKEGMQFKGRFHATYFWPQYSSDNIGHYQGNMKGSKQKERIPAGEGSDFKGRFHATYFWPQYSSDNIGRYKGNIKRKTNYKNNPNSHEESLKNIPPKSGAYKAMTFQGNFKVKKTYEKGMHPSSKYTTYHKPLNSLEEKEKVFKFRIWWAKLIKKNENQPPAVKDKVHRPRYDKNEKDLWYD